MAELDRTFKKYENEIPYPSSKDFTMVIGLDMNKLLRGEDAVLFRKPLTEYDPKVDLAPKIEKIRDDEAYKKASDAYAVGDQERYVSFKTDLFDEYGVSDSPKRDAAFSIAWDYGHSSGFSDVASYFDSLADLIKDDTTEELRKLVAIWRADGKVADRFADEVEQVLAGRKVDDLK